MVTLCEEMQNYDQLGSNAKETSDLRLVLRMHSVETILILDLKVQAWVPLEFTSYLLPPSKNEHFSKLNISEVESFSCFFFSLPVSKNGTQNALCEVRL